MLSPLIVRGAGRRAGGEGGTCKNEGGEELQVRKIESKVGVGLSGCKKKKTVGPSVSRWWCVVSSLLHNLLHRPLPPPHVLPQRSGVVRSCGIEGGTEREVEDGAAVGAFVGGAGVESPAIEEASVARLQQRQSAGCLRDQSVPVAIRLVPGVSGACVGTRKEDSRTHRGGHVLQRHEASVNSALATAVRNVRVQNLPVAPGIGDEGSQLVQDCVFSEEGGYGGPDRTGEDGLSGGEDELVGIVVGDEGEAEVPPVPAEENVREVPPTCRYLHVPLQGDVGGEKGGGGL